MDHEGNLQLSCTERKRRGGVLKKRLTLRTTIRDWPSEHLTLLCETDDVGHPLIIVAQRTKGSALHHPAVTYAGLKLLCHSVERLRRESVAEDHLAAALTTLDLRLLFRDSDKALETS